MSTSIAEEWYLDICRTVLSDINNNRNVSSLLDPYSASVYVGLKVVDVMWGVDLCNIICIDRRMRSVVCCGCFEKEISSAFCSCIRKFDFTHKYM
jgi:hypothetical protein